MELGKELGKGVGQKFGKEVKKVVGKELKMEVGKELGKVSDHPGFLTAKSNIQWS